MEHFQNGAVPLQLKSDSSATKNTEILQITNIYPEQKQAFPMSKHCSTLNVPLP